MKVHYKGVLCNLATYRVMGEDKPALYYIDSPDQETMLKAGFVDVQPCLWVKVLTDEEYNEITNIFFANRQIQVCKIKKIEIWRDNELPIEYKRLTENELDIFIEMRINQLREEGAKEDIDLKPALKDYYSRHMTEGTFVSWIAVDGNKIIGTSGMSFVEKPPYFSCPSGKIGLLSSMFTEPDYRRMGIAKELLHRVIEEARKYGCGSIQITASDMGVKLYKAYGFVHNGNFMQYKL